MSLMKLKNDLLEKEVQKHIIDYLSMIGAYFGKTKTMGYRRGNRWHFDKYLFVGFPDITCFYKDRIIFIEVKRKGNKQSKAQKIFQDYCNNSHIQYILAYSLDDVRQYFEL